MKKTLRITAITAFLLMAPLLVCFSACSQAQKNDEPQIVRIGGVTDPLTDSIGIAQKLGYIEEELAKIGFTPEYSAFAQAGPALNEALAAKAIDFGVYTEFPQLILFDKGVAIRAIATVVSNQQYGIIAGEGSGIKTVRDLTGKKVIVPKGTALEKVFYQVVNENGLDSEKIEQINALADQQSLYASGEADAVVGSYLALMLLQYQSGGSVVFSTAEKPEWSSTGLLVGRGEFLDKNPDVAKALIQALERAYQFASADPEKACEVLSDERLSVPFIKKVYEYSPDFAIYNPILSDEVIARVEGANDFLAQQGIISKKADLSKFIDKTYYAAVQGKS